MKLTLVLFHKIRKIRKIRKIEFDDEINILLTEGRLGIRERPKENFA